MPLPPSCYISVQPQEPALERWEGVFKPSTHFLLRGHGTPRLLLPVKKKIFPGEKNLLGSAPSDGWWRGWAGEKPD